MVKPKNEQKNDLSIGRGERRVLQEALENKQKEIAELQKELINQENCNRAVVDGLMTEIDILKKMQTIKARHNFMSNADIYYDYMLKRKKNKNMEIDELLSIEEVFHLMALAKREVYRRYELYEEIWKNNKVNEKNCSESCSCCQS